MTFLQPWLLLALPLVALPVIIHLMNRRRFQSVEWAAMMFLVSAQTLSRGASRLRQWLIMLLRMLAVAAVILAVSRPLSQGWLAAATGDRSAAAVVLLDRSPSMSQTTRAGGASKLSTARRQVAEALATLGTQEVVLIDSVSCRPQSLASPQAIREIPEAEPAAAAADLPQLLQAACDHLRATKSAAATVWICSDQRVNDWRPADAVWPAIRESVMKPPQQMQLTLLAFTDAAPDNLAVRVTRAVLEPRGKAWELVLDVALSRQADTGAARVPLSIELGSARSSVDVELNGTETVLTGHAIPIDLASLVMPSTPMSAGGSDRPETRANGWGRVSIPVDSNPADNDFYFAFGTSPIRRTLIVTEDAGPTVQTGPRAGQKMRRTLELVAGIPPDKTRETAVDTATADSLNRASLDDTALLLWQAALPEGEAADVVGGFVARGGHVIFMPPESMPPESNAQDGTPKTFHGIAWTDWKEHRPPVRPMSWRADEGLLAATRTGESLPVGELEIRRSCGILGEATPLAMLPNGRPLLVRAASDRGGIYFLATTPDPADSDLATNGIVLYAVVQRAIDAGLVAVAHAGQVDAGSTMPALSTATASRGGHVEAGGAAWHQIAGPPAASTEVGFHAGVYASQGRLVAVNRPASEDAALVAADPQIDALFRGLSFNRFRREAGSSGSIVTEVWRPFMAAVLLALMAEGLLSLPRVVSRGSGRGDMPAGRMGREAAA